MYWIYILACADDSYFIGVSKKPLERFDAHQSGAYPNLPTYYKRPVQLVYKHGFHEVRDALEMREIIQSWDIEELQSLMDGAVELPQLTSMEPKMELEEIIHLPTSYLPPMAWFAQLKKNSRIVLSGGERYRKQTYRTRASIFGANGIQNIVVPVTRPNGKDTIMSDTTINYDENWQKDHIKAIVSAYGKAPYFEYFGDELLAIIKKKHTHLLDLNLELIHFLFKAFSISCQVDIDHQLSELPISTHELMIPKKRTQFHFPPYYQVLNRGEFEQNLSAIDALFNNRILKIH